MAASDDFEVLEKIGHGSFGVIRKVRRREDGFIMCRKEISYLRMSPKEREQLHAEFQILSHLRHPNIVAYYHREHLKESQDLHLYMEYCGNGDLGRVIKDLSQKGQRAQEAFVWSIFSQLVSALYRCHYGSDPPEVGSNVLGLHAYPPPKPHPGAVTILHRDLKPENVFLGEDNSVKLGDFGLSKMIRSHDFASTYVGTPFYMSPEICAAEKYTHKSDIWSLGCIVYELCAREPPFNAKSHYQLVQKIKDGHVTPLPDFYSPELMQVVRDCLRVNPDSRPDTAQLLSLPVVRLMRKEKEVADLNRVLRVREEALIRREQEAAAKLSSLEGDQARMRQETDASLRREWEVKARLEIDRQVAAGLNDLKQRFEIEVQARVESELRARIEKEQQQQQQQHQIQIRLLQQQSQQLQHQLRQQSRQPGQQPPQTQPPQPQHKAVSFAAVGHSPGDYDSSRTDWHNTSLHSSSSNEPSLCQTEATDISIDSPQPAKKHAARTPFARAQTMYAGLPPGTPMDIEMVSPSNIGGLNLSPRRIADARAPAVHDSLFAVADAHDGGDDHRWEFREAARPVGEDDLSDEDNGGKDLSDGENDELESPTHAVVKTRTGRNPFKNRPLLLSQKSAPIASRTKGTNLLSCATVPTKTAAAAEAAAAQIALQNTANANAVDITKAANTSNAANAALPTARNPPRRLGRFPTVTGVESNTGADHHALATRSNSAELARSSSTSSPSPTKYTVNIRGRTLVELQQERAGGRPLSAVLTGQTVYGSENEDVSQKRVGGAVAAVVTAHQKRRASSIGAIYTEVAVWDAATDDMPSPFLGKHRPLTRV